jgi:hypothetical protein
VGDELPHGQGHESDRLPNQAEADPLPLGYLNLKPLEETGEKICVADMHGAMSTPGLLADCQMLLLVCLRGQLAWIQAAMASLPMASAAVEKREAARAAAVSRFSCAANSGSG